MNGTSPAIALWIGVIGALVLMGGLSWLAVASIIRRRALPADRYRGPSVLVIFAMIELGLPFLIWGPRRARAIAFGGLVAMQVGVALTANYGFFNPLSAAQLRCV